MTAAQVEKPENLLYNPCDVTLDPHVPVEEQHGADLLGRGGDQNEERILNRQPHLHQKSEGSVGLSAIQHRVHIVPHQKGAHRTLSTASA